jgi:hypothetical protein
MLVIVASRYDRTAEWLGARWASHDVGVLTGADLSVAGWRYHVGSGQSSQAVIGGQVVAVKDITGILIRMPSVGELELPHIAPEDRRYVSAEMTAFLASWLFSLQCSMLNRPTPVCLAGPNLREAQWVRLAAQAGIPVRPMERASALSGFAAPTPFEGVPVSVTVVGGRCFGSADETLKKQARCLARAAGVDLFTVFFSGATDGAEFLNASLLPDVASFEIADAILEYFTEKEPHADSSVGARDGRATDGGA